MMELYRNIRGAREDLLQLFLDEIKDREDKDRVEILCKQYVDVVFGSINAAYAQIIKSFDDQALSRTFSTYSRWFYLTVPDGDADRYAVGSYYPNIEPHIEFKDVSLCHREKAGGNQAGGIANYFKTIFGVEFGPQKDNAIAKKILYDYILEDFDPRNVTARFLTIRYEAKYQIGKQKYERPKREGVLKAKRDEPLGDFLARGIDLWLNMLLVAMENGVISDYKARV